MPQKKEATTRYTDKNGPQFLRKILAAAALPRAVLRCRSFFKSLFSKGEDRPLPQRTLLAAAICLPLAAICLSTVTENAFFILGEERGRGMDKAYFSNAADKGRGSTEYQVGIMLSRGEGVSRDMEKALFWLREAASQGHVDAQIALGTLYAEGEGGTPQDKAEAVNWLLALAGQGNTDAQAVLKELEKDMATDTLPEEELLARAYASLEGKGVPQDKAEAARWFRKAAIKGNVDAQWQLATLCDEGDGLPQDKWMAAAWYFEACDHGEDRKGRQAVENLGVDVDDLRQNRKVMNVLMNLRMGMAKCTLLYAHDGKCMTSQGKARLAEKDIATSEISTWALDSLACLKAENGNDLPPRIRELADAVQAEAEELRRRMMAD